jgi:hypothetical protein
MTKCSFIIEEPVNINFFDNFDWDNFELIYTDTNKTSDNLKKITTFLQRKNCKYIKYQNESTFEEILNNISSPYFCFLTKNDQLNIDFSNNILSILNNANYNKIVSGYGYLQRKDSKELIVNIIKKIKSPNKIYKNFDKPYYYNTAVKYFFETKIVKESGLTFKYSSDEFRLRYCNFVYQYCLEMFKINGYLEPEYEDFILDFSIKEFDNLTQDELNDYQDLVFDTHLTFENYINNRHLYLMKVNRFLKKLKSKLKI